jgi:hypothetical protein
MNLEIIIVNYNLKQQTEILLNQLQRQTDTDFKITLIDQASTEAGTEEFLNKWEPFVNLIKNSTNESLNQVWNNNIKNSHCEIITLLNNDVEVTRNYVKHTKEAFETKSNLGCVIHATNNHRHSRDYSNLDLVVEVGLAIKQGWEFSIKKDWWVENPIPECLHLYFGDDYIFDRLYTERQPIGIIISSPILHHHSLTEKKNIHLKNNNKKIFENDKHQFIEVLKMKHFLKNDFKYSRLNFAPGCVLKEIVK